MQKDYRDSIDSALQSDMSDAWRTYVDHLHQSLERLEQEINDVSDLRKVCTDEWCEATECILDEVSNAVFTVHEPRWSSKEDTDKLKALKKRVHDLHAKHKGVTGSRK